MQAGRKLWKSIIHRAQEINLSEQSHPSMFCHQKIYISFSAVTKMSKPIHPDFLFLLELKEKKIIDLFKDAREFILDMYPGSNEILYHTHALTTVFSLSDKLSDAFCMLPIYTSHLNLGFNKGTLLKDPYKLLTGTGNLIRHIPVAIPADYRNKKVKDLLRSAVELAAKDMDKPTQYTGYTISKIKKR